METTNMQTTVKMVLAVVTGLMLATSRPAVCECAEFEIKKGDRIAVIGNTLADRMQHSGWLEALLHARFPEHELVVRDLGFSGDTLTERPRSDNFGTPDEWLKRVRADVVIAFFGRNESFAGEAGLPQFRQDLGAFVDHTLSQQYNGRSAPRLVLVGPMAHEDLKNRHLSDGVEDNRRMAIYSACMAEVAQEKNVPFVGLFQHSQKIFALTSWDDSFLWPVDGGRRDRFGFDLPDPRTSSGAIVFPPVTLNGIHPTDHGNQMIAIIIDGTLFDNNKPVPEGQTLDRIRTAVLDKNLHWHNVYRATDGYSVFGGRSGLRFVGGQTNFDVMQRELQILEVMVANRDKVIWAAARGEIIRPDDTNLPEPVQVQTNKPGQLDNGAHRFLGGEEAISEMTVHSGMKIGLFASEEQFPELANPVQSAVDTDGRLWVAAWPTYPHWNPLEPMNDKLLILPDDDGDGKADRCITFASGLHNPTGFEFWNNGVLVAMAPDIFYLKDTDGDDVCDIRERIFHGLDSADTHHTANGFVMGPNGRFYFSRGIFHAENFETPWSTTFRAGTGGTGVYEFDPLRFDIRFHFPIGPNPHGDVIDKWGNQFATDGTGGTGNYIGFPGRGAPKQLYNKRVRPVPAITILDSPHFPDSLQGNLLIANVIGFQGVTQYDFEQDGASISATEVEPIVYSTDPNFRPSDMEIGGDGALYILDWQNPLIGHMQHNLRDPSRDHRHGRVYRVTAENGPVVKTARMKGAPVSEVVERLGSPVLSERYRARIELTGRESNGVIAAVQQWISDLDPAGSENSLKLVEALWVHQQHRVPNISLLQKVLQSPAADARAAGVRVLREWYGAEDQRSRNPLGWESLAAMDADEWLIRLSSDNSAKVRGEVVVAAALVNGPRASEALFSVMQQPVDVQIEFNLREAMKSVDVNGYLRRQLEAGKKLSPGAEAYALSSASVEDLLKMERNEGVCRAILTRSGVPLTTLQDALKDLARLRNEAPVDLLFELIDELNAKADEGSLNSLTRLLSSQPPAELARVRDQISSLARTGKSAESRQVAFASWVTADGNAKAAIAAAADQPDRMKELLRAIPLISSDQARATLYESLQPLLGTLPGTEGTQPLTEPGIHVDYFYPSANDVAVETLARMKPKASGIVPEITMNVPQRKQPDQFALRFQGSLRIETAGEYQFFISSDDGSRFYVGDRMLINNDGLHGMSEKSGRIQLDAGLHPITVTYFDNGGGDGLEVRWSGPGFRRQSISASVLGVPAPETLQDLAIQAMTGIPGHETRKAADLIDLIRERKSTKSAFAAIGRIPATDWPDDRLGYLGEGIVRFLAETTREQRNAPEAAAIFDLADSLAARLPADRAARLNKRIDELRVPLIEIGTVRERMIYDREMIIVQAGRPVEFRLSNTDNMPHNFAVVVPGALEEVGELSEATGRDPDAAERQFIPASESILVASKLLQPEQSQSVFFEVPAQPGIYPYVCTYPGHWRRMYGALYVVADTQAYEKDPGGYLASNDITPKDPLLKYLGRNTDWTVDDLKGDAMHIHRRVSQFAVGQQLFRVASCVGCHKLGAEGNNIGPDLTKLPAEYSSADVLEHILDPSKKIDPKYQSSVVALKSGKVLTGLVIEQSKTELKMLDNPSLPDKPVVILVDDIEERQLSSVSIMPKGVLNKLTREEILDLLAYVIAGGNKEHKLYATEAHQHP